MNKWYNRCAKRSNVHGRVDTNMKERGSDAPRGRTAVGGRLPLAACRSAIGKPLASGAISPFLSSLSLSLSVLRRLVPLLLARLRLRQTCYVITVGAHSGKFSVSWRVAATLSSPQHSARDVAGLCSRQWYTNSEKFMNWVLNLFELYPVTTFPEYFY